MSAPVVESAQTIPFLLDGKPVLSAATFPVVNASSNQLVHHAQSATVDEALAAASSSGRAFRSWRSSTHITRRSLIEKVASIYEREVEEFVRLQQLETSASAEWSLNNVMASIAYLKEIAARISGVEGTIPQNETPGTLSFIFKEPVGTILCIPPWNAAMILATRGIATAIAAGCTVVLKASELSPGTHYKIAKCFAEAGAPPGVLNSIQVHREDAASVTEALIADRNIRKIEFIGSAGVGRMIGATAAKHLKPVLMELGGKCPAIILDDADLEQAAELCAKGAVIHHGQICFSTERIILVKGASSNPAHFEALITKAFERNQMLAGVAVNRAGVQHAVDVLEDAKSKGARFLIGESDLTGSASLKPSIVFQPTREMRIRDEESFGPSASFYIVSSDEEAIEMANESAYGLNATVHTKDLARGLRVARELEYGQVHINSISTYVSPTGSQGGVKGSGWGRQNSRYGFEEFVVEKFVSWRG